MVAYGKCKCGLAPCHCIRIFLLIYLLVYIWEVTALPLFIVMLLRVVCRLKLRHTYVSLHIGHNNLLPSG